MNNKLLTLNGKGRHLLNTCDNLWGIDKSTFGNHPIITKHERGYQINREGPHCWVISHEHLMPYGASSFLKNFK